MACVFCDDSQSAGELVVAFDDWSLLLHPDSAVRGHAMLVAKRHIENFADLTGDEAQEFARVARVCERALLDVTRTDRAILMKLGIATPHLHIHIYPVSRALDREAVQRIIDAKVREDREPGFAGTLRDRIRALDIAD